ncbi:MAG TPA: hypothetical protein VLW05_09700 [Gaiellaceae bacterium]|nr:hypothetical protein [Gaiellaceae bacterium]
MLSRLVLVVSTVLALAAADLVLKALLPTTAWDYHQRSHAWSVVALVLLGALLLVGLLPSRLASVAAAIAAGGVAGNVLSARMHGGRVPNPLVVGTLAFNLADVLVVVAAPLLTVALVRVAIRNRAFIDRHVPPRPWEHALRRRLGL